MDVLTAAFSVCFLAPRLRPPDAAVAARVAAWSEDARVRAIITHESGGDPRAVSATGCAGLAAICGSGDLPACCERDAADGYRTVYDLCNSEAKAGYRCDFAADPRFDPVFAVSRVVSELKGVDARLTRPRTKQAGVNPDLLVAMSYNAGLAAFPLFPSDAGSVEAAMAQLDLGQGPYADWNPQSRANKAVEVYDYLRWYPYLAGYWRKGGASVEEPGPELLCFHSGARGASRFRSYAPGSPEEKRIREAFSVLPVRRLSFGNYERAAALFHRGEWAQTPSDLRAGASP